MAANVSLWDFDRRLCDRWAVEARYMWVEWNEHVWRFRVVCGRSGCDIAAVVGASTLTNMSWSNARFCECGAVRGVEEW